MRRTKPSTRFALIETLESRIAPAAVIPVVSPNGHKATWTDVDGDKVTLTITKGTLELDGSNFDLESGPTQGAILQKLDLSAAEFKGTAVTLTAVRDVVNGGDNQANIGFLDAHGNTLGAIKINGDLAKISAGLPGITLKKAPKAFASLTVNTMGQYGASTLDPSELGVLASEISGATGAIKVRGSVTGITFGVVGGDLATIAALGIGGSLVGTDDSQSGSITTTGGIKTISIAGSILGGHGQQSGTIEANGAIGKVTVRGSIIGGHSATEANDRSAFLHSDSSIGTIVIGGSIEGGTQQSSGVISAGGNVGSLTVAGSVRGGDAGTLNGAISVGGNIGKLKISGDLTGGAAQQSGYVKLGGNAKSVSIVGSVRGGSAFQSGLLTMGTDTLDVVTTLSIGSDVRGGSAAEAGSIETTGPVLSASILGSLIGGSGDDSGALRAAGIVKKFTLGGSIRGGDLTAGATQNLVESGYLEAGSIVALTVKGGIVTGTDFSSAFKLVNSAAIRVANNLGNVTIKGSIEGNSDAVALITSRGQAVLTQNQLTDVAMGKIVIGGRVAFADILAGYNLTDDITAADANPNAQITSVTVTGDWIASNLLAGVALSNTLADGHDTLASGVDNPDIDSTIGTIAIKGTIAGTAAAGDHYAFAAQLITSFNLGAPPAVGTAPATVVAGKTQLGKVLLNKNGGNDNSPTDPKYNFGSTGDTRLFELALT